MRSWVHCARKLLLGRRVSRLRSRRRKDRRCHVAREATPGVAKRDDTTDRDTSLHAAAQSVANRVSATILSQAVPQAVVEIIVESLAGPPATRTVKKVQESTRRGDRTSFPAYVILVSDEGNDTDRARYVSPTV